VQTRHGPRVVRLLQSAKREEGSTNTGNRQRSRQDLCGPKAYEDLEEIDMRLQDKVTYGVFVWLTGIASGYAWAWFALTP
jgi:hypothetical protein